MQWKGNADWKLVIITLLINVVLHAVIDEFAFSIYNKNRKPYSQYQDDDHSFDYFLLFFYELVLLPTFFFMGNLLLGGIAGGMAGPPDSSPKFLQLCYGTVLVLFPLTLIVHLFLYIPSVPSVVVRIFVAAVVLYTGILYLFILSAVFTLSKRVALGAVALFIFLYYFYLEAMVILVATNLSKF